ncbi:hypothetical protein [Oceaniglobus roseus]|uniref:hypothetical protein n=1 Tax=Oceaniglobus roseus TaxID=1737570 RepID=UPI000C7EE0C5|nr:hypothetical protein [Kandeliimicrobium roseum]
MDRHPARHARIHPARQTALTDIEFCIWAGDALPGEQKTYHIGFLSIDCCQPSTILGATEHARINGLARSARWAFEMGLVHLVQRRLGPNHFAYIAIARPKPRARRVDLADLLAVQEAA